MAIECRILSEEIINVRSALAVVGGKKRRGMLAILHNSGYNDYFLSFKNENAKNCAKLTYNPYYVTLLGVVFGVRVETTLCFFILTNILLF